MDVLERLAGNLSGLERLKISAGLDLSRIGPIRNLRKLKELEWQVYFRALRGVEIGSDLTLCIPLWFQEFVEDASVSVHFEHYKRLRMKGKIVEYVSDGVDGIFRG
jgi:hypothetical protein